MIRASHRRRILANALAAAAILLCAAIFVAPPGQAGFWPACPIHQLLGIECPGCGATRALAALLHGHLLQALRLNALFVLLLPLGVIGAIQAYRRAHQPGTFRWPHPPGYAIYSAVAISAVFTIARNLAS